MFCELSPAGDDPIIDPHPSWSFIASWLWIGPYFFSSFCLVKLLVNSEDQRDQRYVAELDITFWLQSFSEHHGGELWGGSWHALNFFLWKAIVSENLSQAPFPRTVPCLRNISHMLHVYPWCWYIYLHNWVILSGQMMVTIPAPWSIWVWRHGIL